MEYSINGITIEFIGFLDEKVSFTALKSYVEQVSKNSTDGLVRLDFSKVTRANSVGILAWARFLDSNSVGLFYINSPEWLVEQFNLCDLLKSNSIVESILAPFYCTETDAHETVKLFIGKDIPVLKDYAEFQIARKNSDGLLLEADFEPSEYFQFIARNFEKFTNYLKDKGV